MKDNKENNKNNADNKNNSTNIVENTTESFEHSIDDLINWKESLEQCQADFLIIVENLNVAQTNMREAQNKCQIAKDKYEETFNSLNSKMSDKEKQNALKQLKSSKNKIIRYEDKLLKVMNEYNARKDIRDNKREEIKQLDENIKKFIFNL